MPARGLQAIRFLVPEGGADSDDCARLHPEPNIFILSKDDSILRIAVYVDNMLIGNEATDGSRRLKAEFIKSFRRRFNIEIMGTPTVFLGMEIERTDDTLTLKQTSYISKAAEKFLSGSSTLTFPSPVSSSKLKEFTEIGVAKTDLERATMRSSSISR